MSDSALENAVVRLLRERPFYGHFILNLRRELRSLDGKGAGVTLRDSIPVLAVDPEIFPLMGLPQQRALLEHLVKHLLHLHPVRRKGRNLHDWDIASDLAINLGIENLPEDALLPEYYGAEDGLAAEEYYEQLAPPFDAGNLDGSGFGDNDEAESGAAGEGDAGTATATTLDSHALWGDADSTPLPLAEEALRAITRESLRGCDGETPPELKCVVDALLGPSPIPWQQILRQFLAAAGRTGRRSSWTREHRRFEHTTPGVRKRRRLNLLIGVDVSDSTNIVELREAFGQELIRIAAARESAITVIYANSRIQRIDSLRGHHGVVERYDGGGFTDLRPVFEYARTMHPLPAAVIYLTDGIGPVSDRMEFPTLWVLTAVGEKPAPWGVELRMEK
ncbi:MAG: VWA-like domain-containing protein [Desulfuromonadaceae bacterium]|nr:VWA-like domain-containing protein [Desulfuromonadaceae bacterium]MDD2854165.1 VWA-like domain-containing protein [Desulfuromonadaceae bacterium]